MSLGEVKEEFVRAFARRFENGRRSPPWLATLRRAGIDRFRELGFPTPRQEDWRYTDVAPLGALEFRETTDASHVPEEKWVAPSLAGGMHHRLVFVDGAYRPEHSSIGELPSGVKVRSLAELLTEENEAVVNHLARCAGFEERAFVALNTAFIKDGAAIVIPKNCQLEEPISTVFISAGVGQAVASHPRVLLICGEGSEVKVLESYVGLGSDAYFMNPVTEIMAAAGSRVDHYRLQREGAAAIHVGALCARLERDAHLASHNLTLGGALVRTDIHALLAGEGAECMLDGLYLTDDRQHVDNHTEIEHAQPRATSREVYKGILSGRARGVFNGKIVVRKAAQKSDARQTNKNLLLSKDSVVNSKPQLEIHADDVKCTHGSAIGQLDPDALFYLRSRGVAAEDARSLLSYGFAAEILGRVKIVQLRERLDEFLLAKFGRTAANP